MKWLKQLFKIEYSCSHKWQSRGQNGYGTTTYRVCLKCREPQQRVNNLGEPDKFIKCEPIPHLDSQFDKNDKFIFNTKAS